MARSPFARWSSRDDNDEAILGNSNLSPAPLMPSNPTLHSPTPTRPYTSSFVPRRPMTPTLLSFRFGASSHSSPHNTPRRPSTHSADTLDKGKEPVRGGTLNLDEDLGRPVWSNHGRGSTDREIFTSPQTTASPSSSASSAAHTRKVQRGSIFAAASDVLSTRLGLARRRGTPTRDIPAPVVLPDVIEITARKRDEEEEERNRLRAEAAQAIGLIDTDVQFGTDVDEDEALEERSLSTRHGGAHNPTESTHSAHYSNGARNQTYTPHTSAQLHDSSTSVAVTSPPPPMPIGHYRSGSIKGSGHSRSGSTNLTPVPAYPSTVSSLAQWQQHAGMVPKYYPSSSLRIFALSNSKNWKMRYIILTSPAAIITRSKLPAVSYLHLFKGPSADEKELERLVINEDSVVFVSDDEVGGRRHVITVGGIEGGAFKKELNAEETGRTMWFLQIEEQAESQKWISGIKTSILNQRALRAGLPSAGTSFGVNEPRGDIDVMLSMRAQGFITSHSNTRQHHTMPPPTAATTVPAEQNLTSASSISEHSSLSQPLSPKTTVLSVSILKGLFSGSRPRSASRATSVDTARLSSQQHQQQNEEPTSDLAGGGGTGNNLLSMLRSATPDLQSQSGGTTTFATNGNSLPIGRPSSPSFIPSETGIDRKISSLDRARQKQQQQQSHLTSNSELAANDPTPSVFPTSSASTRAAKAISLGSISLHPPPRKRWTSTTMMAPPVAGVAPTINTQPAKDMYNNAQLNCTTGSLGALTYTYYNKDALSSEPGSPTATSMMTGTTDLQQFHSNNGSNLSHGHGHHQGVRPPSVQSTSTYATSNGGDSSLGIDRTSSNASTKNTGSSLGIRRWSRQGQGPLPPRTSPPLGPPPNPPLSAASHNFATNIETPPRSRSHTTNGDDMNRPNSRASSAMSTQSEQSIISSLPSFSKRTSVSSAGTTSSNSHSANGNGHGVGAVVRGPKAHRSSMPPPPRPAPTSALPPAPDDQSSPPHSPTRNHDPYQNRSQNKNSNSRGAGRNRPRSVDSSVPNPAPKSRGFRLSMIAPSKPPPSSNLPPRPDEFGEYDSASQSRPSSVSSRRISGANMRLSRLNPIPGSPDLNGSSGGAAPFPPPRGPLPPTPSSPDTNNFGSNNTRQSSGLSRHTSLRQRLRILSAPSPSPATTASSNNQSSNDGAGADGANASNTSANANACHSTSAQASSNISNISTNNLMTNPTIPPHHNTTNSQPQSHPQIRSFASRFHHPRRSSLTNANTSSPPSSRLAQLPPPPIFSTPSYLSMSNDSQSQPGTPIGGKIISFQEESSFLNLVFDPPISPTMPLPPQSPSPPPVLHGGPLSPMSMGMTGMSGVPIRPLPAIPVAMQEVTPLSPPPRRNSKHLVVVDRNTPPPSMVAASIKPSPPGTPSTPSIFEDTFGTQVEVFKDDESPWEGRYSPSQPPPHIRTETFGPPSPLIGKVKMETNKGSQKQMPLLLSLPSSPSLQSTNDEMSATPPDTPSYETHGMSPSSPASIFSLGMRCT